MYDGTAFHGSQLQGETPTVQLEVNKALSTLLRTNMLTVGASRTDEGVHALCNYYHFDTEKELPAAFLYNFNAVIPRTIAGKNIYLANDSETNARFAAVSRQYRYRIYARRNPFLVDRALFYPFAIDKDVLDETAGIIKEYEQFESFSKRKTETKTFKCKIATSYWEEKDGELHYIVEANRFLRGMVRGLVATQLHIARGKLPTDTLRRILEAQDCTKAYFNVAGHGLYLEQIVYPEGLLTRVM